MSVIGRGGKVRPLGTSVTRWLRPASSLLALALTGAVFVIATWWFAAPASIGAGAGLIDAGRLAGLLAGYVALIQVLLRARLPVIECSLGTDSISSTHGLFGGYLVALIIGHGTLITTGYAAAARLPILQELPAVAGFPYVWLAMAGAGLLTVVAISALPPVRRRLLHEAWHGLHVLVYLALLVAFFHQITVGEHFRHHSVLRGVWTALFAAAAATVLVSRVGRPIWLSARHRLVVAAVVRETADVISIRMAGRDLDRLHVRPGQYFRWRFLAPGAWHLAHPFSLSEEPDGQNLRITVRMGGPHTSMLQHLRPGTRVVAEGPSGGLVAAPGWLGPVTLIAGGVGITPLRALFATASCADRSISLIYRARSAADVIFRSELEEIAKRRDGEAHFLLGRRDDPGNDLSAGNITRLCPDLPRSQVFVCGPPGYTKAVRASLDSLGIPARRVRSESFRL